MHNIDIKFIQILKRAFINISVKQYAILIQDVTIARQFPHSDWAVITNIISFMDSGGTIHRDNDITGMIWKSKCLPGDII